MIGTAINKELTAVDHNEIDFGHYMTDNMRKNFLKMKETLIRCMRW